MSPVVGVSLGAEDSGTDGSGVEDSGLLGSDGSDGSDDSEGSEGSEGSGSVSARTLILTLYGSVS